VIVLERKQRDQLKDCVFLLFHLSPVLSSPMAAERQVPASNPVAHTSRAGRLHQPAAPRGAVVPEERPARGIYEQCGSA